MRCSVRCGVAVAAELDVGVDEHAVGPDELGRRARARARPSRSARAEVVAREPQRAALGQRGRRRPGSSASARASACVRAQRRGCRRRSRAPSAGTPRRAACSRRRRAARARTTACWRAIRASVELPGAARRARRRRPPDAAPPCHRRRATAPRTRRGSSARRRAGSGELCSSGGRRGRLGRGRIRGGGRRDRSSPASWGSRRASGACTGSWRSSVGATADLVLQRRHVRERATEVLVVAVHAVAERQLLAALVRRHQVAADHAQRDVDRRRRPAGGRSGSRRCRRRSRRSGSRSRRRHAEVDLQRVGRHRRPSPICVTPGIAGEQRLDDVRAVRLLDAEVEQRFSAAAGNGLEHVLAEVRQVVLSAACG